MTALERRVRRVTPPMLRGERDIVVELSPPNLISLREKGRRKSYTITLSGLYAILALREVENARAKRKPRRIRSVRLARA